MIRAAVAAAVISSQSLERRAHDLRTTNRLLLLLVHGRAPQPQVVQSKVRIRQFCFQTPKIDPVMSGQQVTTTDDRIFEAIGAILCFFVRQNGKAQEHLRDGDHDTDDNKDNDDPGDVAHLCVGHVVGQNAGQVEEDLATLVENLGAGFDLEVVSDGFV